MRRSLLILTAVLFLCLTYSRAKVLKMPSGLALAANGDLWVGEQRSLLKFNATQFEGRSEFKPSVQINSNGSSLNLPASLGFDQAGNLWVSNYLGNSLVKFTPTQLETSSTPEPSVTVRSADLEQANAFAFDATGGAWVASAGKNLLLYFTTQQLEKGGTIKPIKTIGSSSGSLDAPAGLQFDAQGRLWVSNYNANTLVRYGIKQLEQGGTPVPEATIRAKAGSLSGAGLMAFDSNGGLWVSNFDGNTVVRFAPESLQTNGDPAPSVVISANLFNPNQIVPTKDGGLWVSSSGNSSVLRYGADQLVSSGSPTPILTLR
jgi:streptogramin lyase